VKDGDMQCLTAILVGPRRETDEASATLGRLLATRLADEFRVVRLETRQGGWEGGVVGSAVDALRLAGRVLAHVHSRLVACGGDGLLVVVAKLCGARAIWQFHGGRLPHPAFRGRRFARWLLAAAARFADVVVVPARMEARAYRKILGVQHVIVVPECIDRAPLVRPAQARRVRGTALRLLYAGTLERESGLYEVLHGLRLAQSTGAAANLVIAGAGPEEDALRRFVRALGVAAHVTFVGPLEGEGKHRLLAETDVLVFAAHAGGLPRVLLEGMAAGAAIVATRVGGIPDVIVDGVHGLFVPPYNPLAIAHAIQRLSADRGLLERMAEACRRRVAGSYSAERLSGDFARLYRELCGGRPVGVLNRS
jgi:glycosyltransferase involved in cell wall biosynthesis